jgi:hypothetical protein
MDSNISCSNSTLLEYLPPVQGVWGSSRGRDISVSGALAEDRDIFGQASLYSGDPDVIGSPVVQTGKIGACYCLFIRSH